ncbi:MAG: LPS export ABC transporter ATP-binding protein [Gammaproteobacteria bacterium]|nr:LPS export ABC transporter ATP-binding protein [Gammaproteobacteria bacterium]
MIKHLLEAKHLKKSFKKRTVVENVNISIESGECVGLLGPNGAGKTTSFYMIVGLQSCDEGSILLNGQDITHKAIHERARLGIGYLPQEASVFRKMSVQDNIYSILEFQKDLTQDERKGKLEQLLTDFNLHHIRNSLGMSLSGGERRRVEISRALATSPQFMLLDEPFAGVDPISVGDIKHIIRQLCDKNIGVLITDHNVRETLDICKRAYIVNKGNILCHGSTEDILSNEQVRQVYLGQEFTI